MNGGRLVLKATKWTLGLAVSSIGSQGIVLPRVSIGNTSKPGNGVKEGVNVGGSGDGDAVGVNVDIVVDVRVGLIVGGITVEVWDRETGVNVVG